MFHDPTAWPPPPDGAGPAPRREPPRLRPAQERRLMRLIGLFLLALLAAPLAGASVIGAIMALF